MDEMHIVAGDFPALRRAVGNFQEDIRGLHVDTPLENATAGIFGAVSISQCRSTGAEMQKRWDDLFNALVTFEENLADAEIDLRNSDDNVSASFQRIEREALMSVSFEGGGNDSFLMVGR